MKKCAILFILTLLTLPALYAAPMSACGKHAFETKHPHLDWSRLTKIELTSFAGNLLMNICIGVDRSTMKIKRIVMRDSANSIQIQETLAGLAQYKELINQKQLPRSARVLTRSGSLMSMRVNPQGDAYVAEIRLHRKLGRLGGTDIRHIRVQGKVNASGDAEASFQGAFFDSLTVKVQTVPSLMLREFIIHDSTRRSAREMATSTLPTATSLGI